MDLTQSKLSREEWESIESPITVDEKHILKMIINGYDNINIRSNQHQSLYSFVKIEITPETEYFLYQKYFEKSMNEIIEKYGKPFNIRVDDTLQGSSIKRLKSADNIRIQNLYTA